METVNPDMKELYGECNYDDYDGVYYREKDSNQQIKRDILKPNYKAVPDHVLTRPLSKPPPPPPPCSPVSPISPLNITKSISANKFQTLSSSPSSGSRHGSFSFDRGDSRNDLLASIKDSTTKLKTVDAPSTSSTSNSSPNDHLTDMLKGALTKIKQANNYYGDVDLTKECYRE